MRDEKIKFALYEAEQIPYYVLVYPEDLKAKIYSLEDHRYRKAADQLGDDICHLIIPETNLK